jgi:hypothetical protein
MLLVALLALLLAVRQPVTPTQQIVLLGLTTLLIVKNYAVILLLVQHMALAQVG